MYGTDGNAEGTYKCTDGNSSGTALAHLPARKFDVFPRLWKWGSNLFLIDVGILELLYIYVFTSSQAQYIDTIAEKIIEPITDSITH